MLSWTFNTETISGEIPSRDKGLEQYESEQLR